MKKIALFIAGAALLLLVSCGAKEALDYNNKLTSIQKSLFGKIDLLKDKATIENYKKIQTEIKASIGELNVLKAPTDGLELKNAMIDDFELLNNEYDLEIKFLNPDIQESEKEAVKADIINWPAKMKILDEKLITAQKKFASAHNIKLQY